MSAVQTERALIRISYSEIVFFSTTTAVPYASTSVTAEAISLAMKQTGVVVGKGRFQPDPVSHEEGCLSRMFFAAMNEPTFHCHGAEIEIDRETGRISVLRYVAAHDVGTVINPGGARGQVEGGVVQGLGYAPEMSMPRSAIAATAAGLTLFPGSEPPDHATARPLAWCSKKPSAICERPAL